MKINIERVIDFSFTKNIDQLLKNSCTKQHLFIANTCLIERNGYLILDFGREICGRVHILFGFNEEGKIRVRTGESVAEVCAEIGEKNAGNYHSLRDAVYPVVGWSDFSTTETGFRFARIDLVEGNSLSLVSIFAEENSNGLQFKGCFACDNQNINNIFEVAKRTTSLCVREDEIWDGIKRDRVVWIGDFYPELLSSYMIYGDIPQFENVLNYVKCFDGHWINNIPAYSAWWVICLEKYLELTSNEEYVETMLPYVEKIVNDFSKIIKDNGDISYANSDLAFFEGNEFFLDWPTNGTKDSEIGWRYLVLISLRKAKKLFMTFKKELATVDSLIERLDKYHYLSSNYKQITALGVLAEKVDDEEARAILKEGGARGMTSFLSFAIIEALYKLGEGAFALNIIEEYYGDMIKMGATTFWEDFDVEWLKDNPSKIDELPQQNRKNIHADYGKFCYKGLRHSLCHGWSCGFLEFFFKRILGILPLSNGYKTIKIEPHLYGLKFVEGTLPTKYGNIYVRHELINGKIKTMLELPSGVERL